MKIKVIGSGSMWNEYNSSSFMIDDNILIDFPNGICKNLFRMNIEPRNIENIIITHFHGDHYFDIPFFLLLKSRANNKNINIFCGKEGKKIISKLFKLGFPNSLKGVYKSINLNYNNSDKFEINNYKINRYIVDHGRMKPAYGYILEQGDKKIGFTGDTTLCENVEKIAETCDYLFCDCMFIKGTKKHMGINNIEYLTKKYSKCKFVVTHLENETREELKKLKIKNVIVPKDEEIIKI